MIELVDSHQNLRSEAHRFRDLASDLRKLGYRGPRSATPEDLDAVIQLILDQQAHTDRNVPSLGVDKAGVTAELEDLEPPWVETLRIVCGEDGTVAGAVVVDWSTAARRAWVNGPWVPCWSTVQRRNFHRSFKGAPCPQWWITAVWPSLQSVSAGRLRR